MNQQDTIAKTADFVREKFKTEGTGHDWWHMYRVWQLAKTINAKEPKANSLIVELGALLHDIADWKFHDGDFEAGPRAARQWLESQKVNEAIVLQIEDIVRSVSYKGEAVASAMKTLEGKIVHDADKLDAIGAIGIARTFAYGGSHGSPMYDPNITPKTDMSFEDYKNNRGSTINHFYEKLLLLKERLYTDSAKQIAKQRHEYMQYYLDEFFAEWEGKK